MAKLGSDSLVSFFAVAFTVGNREVNRGNQSLFWTFFRGCFRCREWLREGLRSSRIYFRGGERRTKRRISRRSCRARGSFRSENCEKCPLSGSCSNLGGIALRLKSSELQALYKSKVVGPKALVEQCNTSSLLAQHHGRTCA
ncbi:hypothetical protein QYF36_002444 [Acer negundo]|nr:hypothetical protein QYF36_002444 [Acer negundo]